MKCPFCQYRDSRVVDSRDTEDSVRRRRKCLSCGSRFTTYERLETFPIELVKRDGRREVFSRDKIVAGVRKACDKRPVSRDQIEALADSVESAILRAGRVEMPSLEVGELVMERLRELDEVAYIRFASVYRRFQDAERFREELDRLDRGRAQQPPSNQLPLFAGNADVANGSDPSLTPSRGGASIDSSARPTAGSLPRGRRRPPR